MLSFSAHSSNDVEWGLMRIIPHGVPLMKLGFTRNQSKNLFFTSNSKVVNRLDSNFQRETIISEKDRCDVKSLTILSLLPEEVYIAIARDQYIEIFRDDKSSSFHQILDHGEDISSIAWEKVCLLSGGGFNVKFWNPFDGTLLREITTPSLVYNVSLSPTGVALIQFSCKWALCSLDRDFFDEKTSPNSVSLTCATIGKKRMMFGGMDGNCYSTTIEKSDEVKTMFGHSNNVRAVHISSDDQRGISGFSHDLIDEDQIDEEFDLKKLKQLKIHLNHKIFHQ